MLKVYSIICQDLDRGLCLVFDGWPRLASLCGPRCFCIPVHTGLSHKRVFIKLTRVGSMTYVCRKSPPIEPDWLVQTGNHADIARIHKVIMTILDFNQTYSLLFKDEITTCSYWGSEKFYVLYYRICISCQPYPYSHGHMNKSKMANTTRNPFQLTNKFNPWNDTKVTESILHVKSFLSLSELLNRYRKIINF